MTDPLIPTPEGVSVIILAKNCRDNLADCLNSLTPFLRPDIDEVVVLDTGSTDDTAGMAEAFGCNTIRRPDLCVAGMHDLVQKYLPEEAGRLTGDPQFQDGFLSDFAAARQIATNAAKNDLIFWLDSDDVLEGGAELRDAITKHFKTPEEDNLFLAYDYSFDPDGTCTTVLWRERVCRRSLSHWVGVCHESMIRKDGRPSNCYKFSAAKIVHKHGRAHEFSDVRNYAILRHAWETMPWKDPRWEYYLGNACRGLSRWQEAVDWYTKTLQRSGARDDRYTCALNIANIYLFFSRPWHAINWFGQANKIHPSEPRAFFGIARCYYELKRWADCILYTQIGRAIPRPQHITSIDPNAFDFYPGIFECLSYKELGEIECAVARAKELVALRPGFEASDELHNDVCSWAQLEQIKRAVQSMTSLAFSKAGALDMIKAVRPEIRKHIPELQVETYCPAAEKSITVLCGSTVEPWDPTSAETGVGGSEKMLLLLSKAWAAAGWRVDIYGSPKPENRYKNFDGVTYKPAESFNPELERDVLLIWRNWRYLDQPLKARRIFIDLHDVQDPANYTPARVAKLSGAFFKSEFHLTPVKAQIGDKAIVSRNAIDPAQFTGDMPARDLKHFLYTSSGDRGLKRALRIFGRARAIHPDATLDVFYGFTPLYLKNAATLEYHYFGDEGDQRHMLDYMEECHELANQVGAKFRGRVGHAELARELRAASAVLYPTAFPEISCMSMMEAQAAGCIPITSAAGALPETVLNGLVLPLDATDDAYVAALDGVIRKGTDFFTQRAEMSASALTRFDIKPLAADWLERFSA